MYDFTENKHDWLWELADGRYFSTRESDFVNLEFADAWLLRSGMSSVPASPADEAGAHSETGLAEGLAFYGLPLGRLASIDEVKRLYADKIQERLDSFARSEGRAYDSIMSACSYAASTNPVYAAEGRYCVQARDATWAAAYAFMNERLPQIEASGGLVPAWEELLAALPALSWDNAASPTPDEAEA